MFAGILLIANLEHIQHNIQRINHLSFIDNFEFAWGEVKMIACHRTKFTNLLFYYYCKEAIYCWSKKASNITYLNKNLDQINWLIFRFKFCWRKK